VVLPSFLSAASFVNSATPILLPACLPVAQEHTFTTVEGERITLPFRSGSGSDSNGHIQELK